MESSQQGQKTTLESLSKEEILNKYKGLLGIAKKAKQAKDEISEENRKLKEQIQQYETQKDADKKALITMKEMLEAYTNNKLELTTQLSDLQKQRKIDLENIEKMSIENESLKRQLTRLSDDNDSLLSNMEAIENELHKERQERSNVLETDITVCNQKLMQDNDQLAKSLNELKEKYTFLKEVNSEQRQKFNSLKDRFIDVHKKLKKLKECKRILLETQHEYADSVTQWQMEIIRASKLLCKELNELRVENVRLMEKLKSNKNDYKGHISVGKLKELLQLCEKVKFDYQHLKEENNELKKIRTLGTKNIIAKPEMNLSNNKLNDLWDLSRIALIDFQRLQENYFQLKKEKKTNLNHNENSLDIVRKLEVLKLMADKAIYEYNQQSQELSTLKFEFDEYKKKNIEESAIIKPNEQMPEIKMTSKEVNDLPLVSDKDNSLISTKIYEEELIELKTQLANMQKSYQEYQLLYETKEKENYELLDEMRELNEVLKARGDCISRLQMELKNKDDKLQDLYHQVHLKDDELKAKEIQCDTANARNEESKQKLEELQNAAHLNDEKLNALNLQLEILKKAQNENDNQSEILSTSTISKADEMQRNKDIEDSFEEKYIKLRGLAAKLKKKLQEEITEKQELVQELQNTKARVNDHKMQLNDLQTIKDQVLEKQKQIDGLKAENQKLKSSRKQANVLNLEIEAAEKSLTDVTNKLALRSSELDAAKEMLKTKDVALQQLRKEIELLEASKTAETRHSQDLRNQINHLQNTLKDAVHSKQQAFDNSKLLEQDIENLKLELEAVRLEMTAATSNLKQSLDSIQNQKEELTQQLSIKQLSLSELERKFKQTERSAEDLKLEYLDYKVKAQAVLKKNQNRDSSKERELEEELALVKSEETQLKNSIESLTKKLDEVSKTKEQLTTDNETLQIGNKELMQLVTEMRLQNNMLQEEIQKHIQQQHETLKQHRQQIDNLDSCHKEQMQSINSQYQRQLEQLKKEYSSMSVGRLPSMIGGTNTKSSHSNIDLDQSKLDFLLMEREDAEGSEEANETTFATLAASRKISNASSSLSNVKRSQHDFMPLDELLNTPINAISCETLITTPMLASGISPSSIKSTTDLLQLELNTTKERLQKQESRVRHLTSLLAENEQDLAKLTQMNDMLKEELRRQERSVEREQHMHNSEYIKNVIMKFLTLNNADEKTRLVPVLNTILKLSRAEAEILNCVAKGQKVSDPLQQRTSGWGNFLPWGGGSGSSTNNN